MNGLNGKTDNWLSLQFDYNSPYQIVQNIKDSTKKTLGGTTAFGIIMALYLFSTAFDFLSIVPGVSLTRLTGLAILIYAFLNGKKFRLVISKLAAALYFLLMFGEISFIFLMQPSSEFNTYFSLAINVLIVLAVLGFRFTEEDVKICETGLIISALLLCMLMFFSSGKIGTKSLSERVVVDLWGSQQDANEFCGYFLFAFAFCIHKILLNKKIYLLVPTILIIYVVLMTGSRGGLISLIVTGCAAGLFALWRSKHRLMLLIALIGGAIVMIILFNQLLHFLPPSVAQRFTEVSLDSGTASYRMRAWGDVLNAFFCSNPINMLFGHGFGSTSNVTFFHDVCHNAYLELLYSIGLFGLVSYLACIFLCICEVIRNRRYAAAAAVIGFMALISSLSAPSMKAFWAVLTVCCIASQVRKSGVQKKES